LILIGFESCSLRRCCLRLEKKKVGKGRRTSSARAKKEKGEDESRRKVSSRVKIHLGPVCCGDGLVTVGFKDDLVGVGS